MEEQNEEIKTIVFLDKAIEITYNNNVKETIVKDKEGYKKLYDAWLLEQPMFISDIYKSQMRDLTYASRNNITALGQINNFLSESNKDEALKFIIYMRKRDLTNERQKWT